MKGIKTWNYPAVVLLVTLFCGCKKLIEIPENRPGQTGTEQVFADSVSAVNAVLGIYVNNFSSGSVLSGYSTYYPALSADELVTTIAKDVPFFQNALVANDAASPDGSAGFIWSGFYGSTVIYQANACIEGLAASKSLTATLKNQLTGECKVIRSLAYFNLSNLFGPVPLALTPDIVTNRNLARTSQEAILAFLDNDLRDAADRLSIAYPSPGRARPNRYTAMALLAKVQLYRKQWSAAEASATAVIQSGSYSLEVNLDNVFLTGSQEAIWQMASTNPPGYPTIEGFLLLPFAPGTIPTVTINPYLLSAFEATDNRKAQWISSRTVRGMTYFFPFKYKRSSVSLTGPSENYIMFRLAEQYLIRAEARVEQGELADGATDLNEVRRRAGLGNTNASSRNDLIKAIMHERQTELFCEWGNRWFDLKRTNHINAVLGAEKAGIWPADGHAALYPVPGHQINLDPALTQNPGY
jgi:hypothetical protein